MPQNFPLNGFKCVEDVSEFNHGFIKSYNEESKEGSFLEVDIQHPQILHNFQNDLPFLPEDWKSRKSCG